jgi:hypothetical protein
MQGGPPFVIIIGTCSIIVNSERQINTDSVLSWELESKISEPSFHGMRSIRTREACSEMILDCRTVGQHPSGCRRVIPLLVVGAEPVAV